MPLPDPTRRTLLVGAAVAGSTGPLPRAIDVVVVGGGLSACVALLLPGAPAMAAERERFDTRVIAKVQDPGFSAYVHAHRKGRGYAGTYTPAG